MDRESEMDGWMDRERKEDGWTERGKEGGKEEGWVNLSPSRHLVL